jgi:hypothetical protein
MRVCVQIPIALLYPCLPNPKSNILINNNSCACLAGFSQLTIASDKSTTVSPAMEHWTARWVRWLSPEYLSTEAFGLTECLPTKALDCYALGMVIYEVLCEQKPFHESNRGTTFALVVQAGKHPSRPQGKEGKLFTDSIWGILELCWKHQPCDCISAKAVLQGLEGNMSPLRPPSAADRDVEMDRDNQSGTGVFSPFLSKLVINHLML